MLFIAHNSNVSVPKVHNNFVDPETQKRYIIMDYIPGMDLEKFLPLLTTIEKKVISARIKGAMLTRLV